MDQPAQNQSSPGLPQSQPPIPQPQTSPPPAQAPTQPSSSGPNLPKPQVNPPLLLTLVALVAVGLGIFLLYQKPLQKAKPAPSPIEDHSKVPEENVFGVNGRIVAIDTEQQIFEVISTTPNWDKSWQVKVGKNTVLASSFDWTAQSGGIRSSLLPEEIAKTVPKKNFTDYKAGDIVYLMAAEGQDFAKESGVFEPFAILLQ